MFQVGDKIFYPMHGGGIISAIEEKEILGEIKPYYVLHLLHRNMQVMIPADKKTRFGIRRIVSRTELDTLFSTFHDGETDLTVPINRRPHHNLEKVRCGDIVQLAEVIRDLVRISSHKKLSAVEQSMLTDLTQLLISEVLLVHEITLKEASELVGQVIKPPIQ